jgi:AcrR family transcriptional regulator
LSGTDRRRGLIDAATRLFAERGFGSTTTREIAQAANVTEAMIFKHFAHKEQLYETILEQKAGEAGTAAWVSELKAASATGDALAVLQRLLFLIMAHSRRDPEFLRLMLRAAMDHREMIRAFRTRHLAPLYQELVRFVQAGQKAGQFRRGNPHAIARVLLAVPSYHALLDILLGGDTLGPVGEEAPGIYADMLLAALMTPRADRSPSRVSTLKDRKHRA